jgi:hypothetical protein
LEGIEVAFVDRPEQEYTENASERYEGPGFISHIQQHLAEKFKKLNI